MDLTLNLPTFVLCNCAYKLGIPGQLPKTIEELSASTGVLPDKLERVLLFLATHGIFKKNGEVWENTELSESMIGEKPHPSIILSGMKSSYISYSKFFESLSTPEPCHNLAHGEGFFEYMQKNPEENAEFNEGMRLYTNYQLEKIIPVIDLSESSKVIDVGGGIGTLMAAIFEKFPHLTGAIQERPNVLDDAKTYIESKNLTQRISVIEGDFFESVQQGYDTIVMKAIIHDWDDQLCIKILKNCKAALAENGRIVIIDIVMDRNNPNYPAQRIADIGMMCTADGKERTREEFEFILTSAGFSIIKIDNCELLSIIYAS